MHISINDGMELLGTRKEKSKATDKTNEDHSKQIDEI